jgi:hypothetical protein
MTMKTIVNHDGGNHVDGIQEWASTLVQERAELA